MIHWKINYKLYFPNNAVPFFSYPFNSLFLLQNLSLFTFVLLVKLEAWTHNIGKYIYLGGSFVDNAFIIYTAPLE